MCSGGMSWGWRQLCYPEITAQGIARMADELQDVSKNDFNLTLDCHYISV